MTDPDDREATAQESGAAGGDLAAMVRVLEQRCRGTEGQARLAEDLLSALPCTRRGLSSYKRVAMYIRVTRGRVDLSRYDEAVSAVPGIVTALSRLPGIRAI